MISDIKNTAVRAIVMLTLSAFFILGVDISRRPDGDGLAKELSSLSAYSGGEFLSEIPSVYQELYQLGAESVAVCSVLGTEKEFAIASFGANAPEEAVSVYKKRIEELEIQFKGNLQAENNLANAEITLINEYAIFTVCDIENTAETLIFNYFG